MELWYFFCLSAAEGSRKLMKPKHISPGKTELTKSIIKKFSLSFWVCKVCINSNIYIYIYINVYSEIHMRCSRENAVIHRECIAASRTGHGIILNWNFSEELMQTLHDQNCVDFYNSIFPGEAKMCLGFMSFRAPSVALKQENYHANPQICNQL